MSDSGSKQTRSEVSIVLVVTGFGIGWLAGLSVSPVVSIVLNENRNFRSLSTSP